MGDQVSLGDKSPVVRVDVLLVRRGLARSRGQAVELIEAGLVSWQSPQGWQRVERASHKFRADLSGESFRIQSHEIQEFVSRAGRKLAHALRHLNLVPQGMEVLDIGQSTGGFTDCLLQQGAARVVGIDVGQGQLAAALQADPRVYAIEKKHVQNFSTDDLKTAMHELRMRDGHQQMLESYPGVDLVVIDVSFISLLKALPTAVACVRKAGWILALVKPQFEVGPRFLNRQGIVKEPLCYTEIEQKMRAYCQQNGLQLKDYFVSEIKGADGNQEYWLAAIGG